MNRCSFRGWTTAAERHRSSGCPKVVKRWSKRKWNILEGSDDDEKSGGQIKEKGAQTGLRENGGGGGPWRWSIEVVTRRLNGGAY